jgi:hypothetical protein
MTRLHVVLARRGLAAAVLVALLACAATVGAAAAAPASHTVTSTRSGTSRSAAGEAIDRHIARDASMRRSDLPAGWTSSPAPADTMGSGCPGLDQAKAAASAHVASREFMLGDSATADSAVYVYADTPTAIHVFAQLTSHRTTKCLVHALKEAVGFEAAAQGATLDSITPHHLIIKPVGDEDSSRVLVVRVSDASVTATAYADVIYVRVGRSIAAFSLGSVGQLFDEGLQAKLADAVTGRLASGLGSGS